MKKNIIISAVLLLMSLLGIARDRNSTATDSKGIFEKYLSEPYPQEDDKPYINPAALKVPRDMKQAEMLQFQMSMDKKFKDNTTILSKPVFWNIFNPHRELAAGTW